MAEYSGGCLCGYISYYIKGKPSFPHLCSCKMCQKWSGALTVAWVEFPIKSLSWNGTGGPPALYRSSDKTQRGFCPKCGGSICAIDDNYDNIAITLATLQQAELIIPGKQHSYQTQAPVWWKITIK